MKHKHYEMIVAKAANMDLVVLIKCQNGWKEQQCNDDQLNFSCGHDYFLCLPQHKEVCLHWLNGGDAQLEDPNKPDSYDDLVSFADRSNWESTRWFMREDRNSRIKPRIEKRWVATINGWNASQKLFATREDAVELLGDVGYQFHEIDVEV